MYPASYGAGFVAEKSPAFKKGGWQFGVDFVQTNWSQYRYYGQQDSVQNKWELRAGGQLWPAQKKNYWSYVSYRAGFFIGPDYIRVKSKLPQFGVSFGLGLPIASGYTSRNQATIINLALEYVKRGNNNISCRKTCSGYPLVFH